MSLAAKLAGVLGGVAIVAALIAFYVVGYLIKRPSPVAASGSASQARLTLQTVASMGYGPHPDWVSYFVKDDKGAWQHSPSSPSRRTRW